MIDLKLLKHLGTRLLLIAVLIIPLIATFASPVRADDDDDDDNGARRAVYTITNASGGNEVVVFDRANDGSLTHQANYDTGGLGTGMGLGSQGAVILSENHRWLFVVNAGSHQISVFKVKRNGLELVDVAESGGIHPISLTIHRSLLYVLNAGDDTSPGNITGFRVRDNGSLRPLDGSTQPLSSEDPGATIGPAQISFDIPGRFLLVTEKITNLLVTYRVDDGIADPPETHPSAGQTPFGFEFDKRNHPIVSEAFGGAPDASALSSYAFDEGNLEVVSASVGTTQTAACWVVISKNGKYAYVANTGSGSISSYQIARDGSLTLLDLQAGLPGGSAIDLALSNNGRFLYSLSGGVDTISFFRVRENGSLEALGNIGVPTGSVGLAAH